MGNSGTTYVTSLLAALASGIAALLIGSYTGPFDPTGSQYGANWPGDFTHALQSLLVHLGILAAVIAPIPRRWSATGVRFAVAAAVFVPIGLVQLMIGHHAGSIIGWHHLWIVGVGVAAAAGAFRMRSVSQTSSA